MYQSYKTYKRFFLCTLGLFLLACNKNRDSSEMNIRDAEADSVYIWIREGRNTNIPFETRKIKLSKAYKKANVETNDSLKTKYFSRLSLAYLRLNDSLNFRKTNQETILLAKKTFDSIALAEAYWDLAEFFRSRSVEVNAYSHFEEAQKIYKAKNDDFHAARMLFNMALVQADVKDYTGSEITTIKAIETLKPLGKYKELYRCYNNLGSVTIELKEFDRALSYYTEALEYLKKTNEKNSLQEAIQNNIGVVYQEKGEHKKAISYFDQVLANNNLIYVDVSLYAKALNNLAFSKVQLKDYSGLPKLFEDAIKIQDSINDIAGASRSYYGMAKYYLDQQDTTSAMTQAQKAKTYSKLSSNNKRLLETLQLLTRIDPQNATNYTKDYITLSDSLQLAERQLRDKFARIRFETDEFIAENETLTKEKRLLAGIAIGVLVMAFLGYLVIDQRRKNQKLRFQRAQQTANQEIFNLMLSQQQKFDEGKKMEQKRISEELHDGVLGKMLGARMVLTGLNKKSDDEALGQKKEALELLRNIEGEIRSISHELSHTAYSDMPNFINSIQNLLETTENVSEINTTFTHDEQVRWDGLSGDIKINLYRIVQESIQNVVKHAQSNNLVVNFAAVNDLLDISIIDDGKGFDSKKRKKGIGMRNISSRIDKLGGSWHIESEKGKGTALYLKIPIMYHSEELDNILKKEGIKV